MTPINIRAALPGREYIIHSLPWENSQLEETVLDELRDKYIDHIQKGFLLNETIIVIGYGLFHEPRVKVRGSYHGMREEIFDEIYVLPKG